MNERRAWLAWAAIALVTIAIGEVDLARTRTKIPRIPPVCSSDAGTCNDVRNREIFLRQERVRRLDHDFDQRVWIYIFVAAAALTVVAVAAAAAQASFVRQRGLYSNAGVAGVIAGFLGIAALFTSASGPDIRPPPQALFLPALVLLGLAAVGGSVTRLADAALSGPGTREPDAEAESTTRGGVRVVIAVFSCTALTVGLALLFSSHQPPSCSSLEDAPGWTSSVAWAAIATAASAGLLALWALAYRRWFVALVCFVVNPAALIWMVLSTGVLC